jgi:hypothetical protein
MANPRQQDSASGHSHPPPNPISLIEVFHLRCEARAILVEAAAMDFIEAVDGLQADALASGLVAEIGQDAVQKIMTEAFK